MELMTHTTPSANRWVARAFSHLKRGLWAATDCSRSENRGSRQSGGRVEPRLKVHFEARISSRSGSMQVRGVDLHLEGASVVTRKPLTPNSVVFVQLKSFGLMGFARVRQCNVKGLLSYAIELEFPSPLMREEIGTWQFHQVRQTNGVWSAESEAALNLSPALRAA
jgi:hypothetical protein